MFLLKEDVAHVAFKYGSVMNTISIIRIEGQDDQSAEYQVYTASVSFNHGVRYACQIRDPFADEMQQEEEWEW
jgi:hypothetical protein